MKPSNSLAQNLVTETKDAAQYQQMKVAHEMEVEATRKLYESLRSKLRSDHAAKEELKKRGYNSNLLKR